MSRANKFDGNVESFIRNPVLRDKKTLFVSLQKISLEWLVAYRVLDTRSYSCVVDTIVVNSELCPLWVKSLALNKNGQLYKEDGVTAVRFMGEYSYLLDMCYSELGLYDVENYLSPDGLKRVFETLGVGHVGKVKQIAESMGYPRLAEFGL